MRKLFGKSTPNGEVINDSDDVMNYLIEAAGVVTITGKAFQRDGYLRLMFHHEDETITGGLIAAKNPLENHTIWQ